MSTLDRSFDSASKGTRLFGLITMIFGFLSIMAPMVTGLALAVMVGILMIAGGIARIAFSFRAGSFGKGALGFLFGGIVAFFGALVLAHPLIGLGSLTFLLISYFLAEGIMEIACAFKVKPEQGWGWMIFNGAVAFLLGVMLWQSWPLSGGWAIGVLVGIKLIFAGSAMMALGSSGRDQVTRKS